MIAVEVVNLSISNVGFVVFLKSPDDVRTLPIFIGVQEAQAIAIELNDVSPPRPLTHDLIKNILDMLDARLEKVVVHNLQDGTFYGRLVLDVRSQAMDIDSRPSDAIALALRCKAPIFVDNQVMAEAGVILEDEQQEMAAVREKKTPPTPDDHLDKLKNDLAKAISDERYEDAAALRDQIRHATQAN